MNFTVTDWLGAVALYLVSLVVGWDAIERAIREVERKRLSDAALFGDCASSMKVKGRVKAGNAFKTNTQ